MNAMDDACLNRRRVGCKALPNRRRSMIGLAILLGTCWPHLTVAYEMYVRAVVGPDFDCVHEGLLSAALACVKQAACPAIPRTCTPVSYSGYRDGVRWNDDPLRLLAHGKTYVHSAAYFHDGGRISKRHRDSISISYNTHYRSHYGDMQFLHSMSSSSQESTAETRRKIMVWTEFMYAVAVGDIPATAPLSEVPIGGIPELFQGKQWSVGDLLSMQCVSKRKCYPLAHVMEKVRQIAVGSILHVVQDSFAAGHTQRARLDDAARQACFGRIQRFFLYPAQNAEEHASGDRAQAWMLQGTARDCLNATTASARILEMVGADGSEAQPWPIAKEYLEGVVFTVSEEGDST